MKLRIVTPNDALSDSLKKHRIKRCEFEKFKENLRQLLTLTDRGEFEEFNKNTLIRFFDNTFCSQKHYINIKGRTDLVIHHRKDADSEVGVIIEAKRPDEKKDMPRRDNINVKALHELILYYLRERITSKNNQITHLIATDFYQWFIFDAQVFDKLFVENKVFVEKFKDFEAGRLSSKHTKLFYDEIAAPYVANLTHEIKITYFDLRNYEDSLSGVDPEGEAKLITLYKVLSPEHLLKLNVANDSNVLNKDFYAELLHIIGLKQVTKGGKKLIQRKEAGERNRGALLENTIDQLELSDRINYLPDPENYGKSCDERLFNVGLELCIAWMNRILFLKLMEAQLVKYHGNEKSFEFLRIDKIPFFGVLNQLFFKVLALKNKDRDESLQKEFAQVPYLNSSLFEVSDIERNFILISSLSNNRSLPLHPKTVVRDESGRVPKGEMGTLKYLLEFLRAYDFSSEGSEEIQEKEKGLISASVLGLIFEKINGYKDGSYFTPGFITEYMCRETIKTAILQKFREAKGWDYDNLTDLHNKIEPPDIGEANKIVNNLKVCDPAVGSGHFLVSALNEIIAVKQHLGILTYRDGRKIDDYDIKVVDDELMITDDYGKQFKYERNHRKSQRLQEALFHEKLTIIENCLFGVDINPNSVNICRLRLWIELLKNAYYKEDTGFRELETLPNIDINIKCGNSLVSRFAIDTDLKQIAKSANWNIFSYQNAVEAYKRSHDKKAKQELELLINRIKSNYIQTIQRRNSTLQKLNQLKRDYEYKFPENGFFVSEPEATYGGNADKIENEKQRLIAGIEQLEKDIEAEKRFFETNNAFEWRFEFPEVLNNDGDFLGFDLVIGNPPYLNVELMNRREKDYYKIRFSTFYKRSDIFNLFIDFASSSLTPNGRVAFIVPSIVLNNLSYKPLRKKLLNNNWLSRVVYTGGNVFEEATVDTAILFIDKKPVKSIKLIDALNFEKPVESIVASNFFEKFDYTISVSGNEKTNKIFDKIFKATNINVEQHFEVFQGIVTGNNPVFIFDEPEQWRSAGIERELLKPILHGRDFNKWIIKNTERSVLYLNSKTNIEKYPKTAEYLWQHKKELAGRRECVNGSIPWYALQWARNNDLLDIIPKIIIQNTRNERLKPRIVATVDEVGCYGSQGLNFVVPKTHEYSAYFLIGIINSTLVNFLFATKFLNLAIKADYIKQISFPKPAKSIINEIETIAKAILTLKAKDQQEDTLKLEKNLDFAVYHLFNLSDEEIQIIENS